MEEVANRVREHLDGLSDAYLQDQLGGVLMQAQNRFGSPQQKRVVWCSAADPAGRSLKQVIWPPMVCRNADKEVPKWSNGYGRRVSGAQKDRRAAMSGVHRSSRCQGEGALGGTNPSAARRAASEERCRVARYKSSDPQKLRLLKAERMSGMRDRMRQAKDKPCADCGIAYPYYVQLDHVMAKKKFNVGNAGLRRGILECGCPLCSHPLTCRILATPSRHDPPVALKLIYLMFSKPPGLARAAHPIRHQHGDRDPRPAPPAGRAAMRHATPAE
jgi:hypothetical protein